MVYYQSEIVQATEINFFPLFLYKFVSGLPLYIKMLTWNSNFEVLHVLLFPCLFVYFFPEIQHLFFLVISATVHAKANKLKAWL